LVFKSKERPLGTQVVNGRLKKDQGGEQKTEIKERHHPRPQQTVPNINRYFRRGLGCPRVIITCGWLRLGFLSPLRRTVMEKTRSMGITCNLAKHKRRIYIYDQATAGLITQRRKCNANGVRTFEKNAKRSRGPT